MPVAPEGPPLKEVSRDPAINEMVQIAVTTQIPTVWDRYKAQHPQCKFGTDGVCCRLCHMGPCRITPKAKRGICGADADTYTDPQKPIQVEPKLYAIGEPGPDSPVLATTNFSLTYFLVSGEIENSGVPAHLVIVESEGMSVLTAWAAGEFNGAKIADAVKASGIENQVRTRRIVIPGYVSQISGEIEEALPGWQVVVGPGEAADLGPMLKRHVQQ